MAAEEWAKKYLMPIIVAAVILAIIQVNAALFRGRLELLTGLTEK